MNEGYAGGGYEFTKADMTAMSEVISGLRGAIGDAVLQYITGYMLSGSMSQDVDMQGVCFCYYNALTFNGVKLPFEAV